MIITVRIFMFADQTGSVLSSFETPCCIGNIHIDPTAPTDTDLSESCWSLFREIHKLFLGICSATGSKNKQTVENRQLFDFEAIVNLVRICLFFHPILNQSPLWVPPPKVLMSRSSSIQYCMFRSNSCGSFGNLGQSFPQS